jgi:hypothetical protein
MSYLWSENAHYVQVVCRPWQPEDGYDEAVVAAAEQKLGLRFPSTLRQFYQSWGARHDLTNLCDKLLSPLDTWLQSDALVFCLENQGVWYWGIPYEQIDQDDPTVNFAFNEGSSLIWHPSHEKVSHFLDFLTFGHAFSGAALHGASTSIQKQMNSEQATSLIQQTWQKITLPSYRFRFRPDLVPHTWPIFVGNGFLLDHHPNFATIAVAAKEETLDKISALLQIKWSNRR